MFKHHYYITFAEKEYSLQDINLNEHGYKVLSTNLSKDQIIDIELFFRPKFNKTTYRYFIKEEFDIEYTYKWQCLFSSVYYETNELLFKLLLNFPQHFEELKLGDVERYAIKDTYEETIDSLIIQSIIE